MGKNIAIVIFLGSIGFIGYYVFQVENVSKDGENSLPQRVKQRVPVIIYSSKRCRYCYLAKVFMDKKGIQYDVRNVKVGKNAQEMQRRTNGMRSIPQIFINRKHIGGWKELQELERRGHLDRLLTGQSLTTY